LSLSSLQIQDKKRVNNRLGLRAKNEEMEQGIQKREQETDIPTLYFILDSNHFIYFEFKQF